MSDVLPVLIASSTMGQSISASSQYSFCGKCEHESVFSKCLVPHFYVTNMPYFFLNIILMAINGLVNMSIPAWNKSVWLRDAPWSDLALERKTSFEKTEPTHEELTGNPLPVICKWFCDKKVTQDNWNTLIILAVFRR